MLSRAMIAGHGVGTSIIKVMGTHESAEKSQKDGLHIDFRGLYILVKYQMVFMFATSAITECVYDQIICF